MRETGEIKAVLGIILPNLVPAPRATLQATSQVSVNGSDGSVATGERNVVSSFQSAPSHVSKKKHVRRGTCWYGTIYFGKLIFFILRLVGLLLSIPSSYFFPTHIILNIRVLAQFSSQCGISVFKYDLDPNRSRFSS